MSAGLGEKNVNKLLWELSVPAILGMLSSAIFNVADRYFVGKINPLALTGVGITLPIQMMQMAIILLVGVGSSTLVSIRLGENNKEEAEDFLFVAFKYIILFMVGFGGVFMLFLNPILSALSVSAEVYPYAKPYIVIMTIGAIIGIPGYCLNNSLRAIGKAKITMQAILFTSILNIILDPILIFVLDLGIAGAAIATVISQTALTIYITHYFITNKTLEINLKYKKVPSEWEILKQIFVNGSPSFYVQILASLLNVYVNTNFIKYGSDMDVAAITIIATIFSFYHMLVFGFVQGNQPIVGFNWGSKQYDRVKRSLELSLLYSFVLSTLLFVVVELYPGALVSIFTKDPNLVAITTRGIRYYLLMLPLIGPQTISSQYFQAVGKPKLSSTLMFMRYGVIMVPAVMILAPRLGVTGIYISNAISDFVSSLVALAFIFVEIQHLKKLMQTQKISNLG